MIDSAISSSSSSIVHSWVLCLLIFRLISFDFPVGIPFFFLMESNVRALVLCLVCVYVCVCVFSPRGCNKHELMIHSVNVCVSGRKEKGSEGVQMFFLRSFWRHDLCFIYQAEGGGRTDGCTYSFLSTVRNIIPGNILEFLGWLVKKLVKKRGGRL